MARTSFLTVSLGIVAATWLTLVRGLAIANTDPSDTAPPLPTPTIWNCFYDSDCPSGHQCCMAVNGTVCARIPPGPRLANPLQTRKIMVLLRSLALSVAFIASVALAVPLEPEEPIYSDIRCKVFRNFGALKTIRAVDQCSYLKAEDVSTFPQDGHAHSPATERRPKSSSNDRHTEAELTFRDDALCTYYLYFSLFVHQTNATFFFVLECQSNPKACLAEDLRCTKQGYTRRHLRLIP
ncbi:hypothetical protein CC2G_011293 [Coprinopsis cinerea AmutBmut pab1-1]|nr:hypothetical protein CC2G_011293 [Coprinopsis cinerea AmutBmut pab1-1]